MLSGFVLFAGGTAFLVPHLGEDFFPRVQPSTIRLHVRAPVGTRLEEARAHFDLPLTSQHFDKHYASVYPSGIFTYNFTQLRLARVSYSRRVSRPNPWQLSPIEFRQDSRNVFHGNPNLGAEYTDALEFSIQDAHKWGSIQLNPYARRTNNAVRNIQYIDTSGV